MKHKELEPNKMKQKNMETHKMKLKRGLKLNKDRALAYGEVTFHSHRADVDVYEHKDGMREFEGPATITHEEHRPVAIPDAKEMVSDIVVEFDYLAKMERKVLD